MTRVVVGADLCKGSWAAIRLVDGAFAGGAVISTLEELVQEFSRGAEVIAVDIPLSYSGVEGKAL